MQRESRVFHLDSRAVRATDGTSPGTFVGHVAVFDQLSDELFGFYERVAPTAFDRAVEGKDDVRFLINHDPSLLLARSRNGQGTLRLSKDETGLVAEADLPDTTFARDLAVSMERGDIDQMSFGFRVLRDSWSQEVLEIGGAPVTITVRLLIEVELFDVSVVTFPAYPQTDAQLATAYRYLAMQPLAWGQAGVAAAASTEAREGKVLSTKNQALVETAIEALQALLAAAGSGDAEEETGDAGAQASRTGLERKRKRLRLLELAQ